MKYDRAHQGQQRQEMDADEAEAQAGAGVKPGVNPELHAESIEPGPESGINLHGDVPGSPYSSNPGEMTLGEAAEQAKANADEQAAADDADTRDREVESRATGVPTERLAAKDEAGGDDPEPAPKRSGGSKK